MRAAAWILASALIVLAPSRASAQGEVRDVPQLAIGVALVTPFGVTAADGSMTGIAVDAFRDLAAASGLTAAMRPLPYARIEAELLSGAIDVAAMADDGKRDPRLVHLGRMTRITIAALGRPGLALRSIEDLSGLKVGARRGGHLERFVPERIGHQSVMLHDFGSGLQMLSRGRLDALVAGCAMLEAAAGERGIARADLGPLLVVGSTDILIMAAPHLRGTRRLAGLRAGLQRMDWTRYKPPEPWCGTPGG
ncbi:MAG: transporter substrate-binding domain-containing protein [Alphaproteobacteria bacterium]|nr:transporter substrate-binding domain-containing protein [Alphaproteobacteria bacterium]